MSFGDIILRSTRKQPKKTQPKYNSECSFLNDHFFFFIYQCCHVPFAIAPPSLSRVNGAQRVDGLHQWRRGRGHGHRGGHDAGLSAQLSVGRGQQLMVLHVVLVVLDQWLVVWGWGGAAWPRPCDVLRFGGASSNPRCRRRTPDVARPLTSRHGHHIRVPAVYEYNASDVTVFVRVQVQRSRVTSDWPSLPKFAKIIQTNRKYYNRTV